MENLSNEDIRRIIRYAYESRGYKCTEKLIDDVMKEKYRQEMFVEWFAPKAMKKGII